METGSNYNLYLNLSKSVRSNFNSPHANLGKNEAKKRVSDEPLAPTFAIWSTIELPSLYTCCNEKDKDRPKAIMPYQISKTFQGGEEA